MFDTSLIEPGLDRVDVLARWTLERHCGEAISPCEVVDAGTRCSSIAIDERMYSNQLTVRVTGNLEDFLAELLRCEYIAQVVEVTDHPADSGLQLVAFTRHVFVVHTSMVAELVLVGQIARNGPSDLSSKIRPNAFEDRTMDPSDNTEVE